MPELIWSAETGGQVDLEEVGWFRPQYNHWFNGHHIGFHGGPKHGEYEYLEYPLHLPGIGAVQTTAGVV